MATDPAKYTWPATGDRVVLDSGDELTVTGIQQEIFDVNLVDDEGRSSTCDIGHVIKIIAKE